MTVESTIEVLDHSFPNYLIFSFPKLKEHVQSWLTFGHPISLVIFVYSLMRLMARKKDTFLIFYCSPNFQESAKSIREKYGSLNLLVNASGILSIPDALQPG